MKRILSILFLATALCADADEFSLVDGHGRKHGPVTLEQGATVETSKEQLSVTEIKRRDEGLKSRLMKIMVPELAFEQMDLAEVVRVFGDASRKYDSSRRLAEEKGVTFTIVLDYDGENMAGRPASEDGWRAKIRTVEQRGKLTGRTRNAPLWSALEAALAQFDAKALARDGIVLVMDHNAAETPITMKRYPVQPTVRYKIADHYGHPGQPPTREQVDPRAFFRSMGVSWPNGSSLRHIPAIGQLVVANTMENLRVLESVLVDLYFQPSQIEIEVQFVAFKKSDIAALAVKGMVGGKELRELREQGKSELLACPKVVTKSGSEAVIKAVEEYIYPTEFTAGSILSTNRSSEGGLVRAVTTTNVTDLVSVIGAVVEPSGFEMREVGAILEVAPDVSPEGTMIDLTFTPQFVQKPEWRDYGCDVKGKDGKKYRLPMQQPFFFAHTISTSVSLYEGESMFIGGGAPSKDPTKVVYIFASARLVGADGKPLRGRKKAYSR